MSMHGVQNEEKIHLSKEEQKRIRQRSLKLLGEIVKPVRSRLFISLALVITSQALRVALPWIIALIVDRALPDAQNGNFNTLYLLVGGYFATSIASGITIAFFMRFAARVNQDIMFGLRRRLFRHTQKLSIEFHETYTSGRVIARQTSDLDSLKELLDSGGNEMVSGILFMFFTAVALVTLDPSSFLIMLVSFIPLFFLTRWFQRNTRINYRKTRVASAKLIVHFVETMTGIRAVKAFRKEKRNQDTYGELVEDYRSVNAKVIQLFGIYDPGLIMIGNITVAFVLLWGGYRVIEGDLGIGVLISCILYARSFYDPMENLAMFYNSYQSANSALEKISGVLEEEPSVPEPEEPVALTNRQGKISFKDVQFAYSNGKVVLPSFDLEIQAGQTVALVGTTGAGKSTLAKLISRFYDPSNGVLELDGIDLRKIADDQLREAVVMVTQEAYLFSGTVGENIALGKPTASQEEIEQAAKAVGAHEFILSLPDGYNTDVNKRGGRVSAGQRQLISFARAFIADPTVLILDEATSSLDIPSERMVQKGLQTLLAGRTAIIIAHRLSTVSIADRVIVMEHGKIIEDDTPATLIAGTGKFAKMHKAWRDSLV
ncbi:MAG: ABC transporter ATP-binding protein/permease [Acidobacteria bacterium]|nr:ABC transporter ATP-binding protein/permease [Acidobacteriota bacterium]